MAICLKLDRAGGQLARNQLSHAIEPSNDTICSGHLREKGFKRLKTGKAGEVVTETIGGDALSSTPDRRLLNYGTSSLTSLTLYI